MPTRQGRLNESINAQLAASAEKLFILVNNGDTARKLSISHINYGYNETIGVPTIIGAGAIHIIEGISLEMIDITPFSPRGINQLNDNSTYLYFSCVGHYGSEIIDFSTPLLSSPGKDVAIIVAPAIDSMGALYANQRAFLTAIGKFIAVEETKFGDYGIR